ncbi:MAG: hypothetical protein ACE15C_11960 [Phycisphaerae bacterium]
MVKAVEGIFKDGKVELLEPPPTTGDTPVIVTFLIRTPESIVDMESKGIDSRQAADLRSRLEAFAEDWSRPEMDVYDAV